MARKVVVPEDTKKKPEKAKEEKAKAPKEDKVKKDKKSDGDRKIKKKKHRCLTCCLSVLITFVVIFAAAFGVGWYFGDKYARQYLGLSLGDTFGVLRGLYWTNDKDVVTVPYTAADADGFYGQIKRNMLLKESADIDFDKALGDALDEYLGGDEGGARALAYVRNAPTDSQPDPAGTEEPTEDESSGGSSILDVFTGMISNVFSAENIDTDRLAAYSETNDTYIFELKDKELAAFVNSAIDKVLAKMADMDSMADIGKMISIKDVVALKQVRFGMQPVKDVQGNIDGAAKCDITVWVGLQKAASQAIDYWMKQAGMSWLSGIAGWLGDVILPENIYATVTVPLQDGASPAVVINDMTPAKQANTKKLIDSVLSMTTGGSLTVDAFMNSFVDVIKPFLKSAEDLMQFNNVDKGIIGFDLLGTVANIANEKMGSEDPLTKADFMYMLQAVLTSSSENRLHELEPYLYKEWYTNGTVNIYKYDSGINTTGYTHIDYEQEFIDAIADAYALDIDPEETKLTDILAMLGISLDGESTAMGSDDLIDLVSAQKLKDHVNSASVPALVITDRMLGAALGGELDSLLTKAGGQFENIKLDLNALTFISKTSKPTHRYALLAVDVDLTELLGDIGNDNMLLDMASKIMPSHMLMSMAVDITPASDLEAGEVRDKTEFWLNDYERTARVLDTIAKIMPSFDMSELSNSVQDMLVDMIDKLNDSFNVVFVLSDPTATPVEPGTLTMPDIFTVMADLVLKDGDTPILTAAELKDVLKALQRPADTDKFPETATIATSDADFVHDVVDKYYLNPDSVITGFDGIADFLGAGSGFAASKFRVNDTTTLKAGLSGWTNVKYMAYDSRTAAQLKPVMSAAEIGYLIKDKMTDGDPASANASLQKFELMKVDTGDDSLTLTFMVDIKTLMGADDDNKMLKLLPIDDVYIVAAVDMSTTVTVGTDTAYPVEVSINEMTKTDDPATPGAYENTLKLIDHFASGFDIDSQIERIGVVMYDALTDLKAQLGGDSFISFTNNGMELASFYSFIANQLVTGGGTVPADEVVKEAIQGMYTVPTNTATYGVSQYNFEVSDIIHNDPTGAGDLQMSSVVLGGTFTDRQFNSTIQHIIDNSDNTAFTAMQTIALAGDETYATDSAAEAVRDRISEQTGNADTITAGSNYLVITVSMSMNTLANNNDPREATNFFPSNDMYVTIVLDKTRPVGKDTFDVNTTLFNKVSVQAYNALVTLMGLNPDATSATDPTLGNVKEACLGSLNSLGNSGAIDFMSATPATDRVGDIRYTLYTP